MSIWIWLGAVFPILFLFLMMSVFHMKTERAAFLGIICAIFSAIIIGKSTPQIVVMDLEKGAFSALNILIVIWPAVFLYEMMEFVGIFQSIKKMLQEKTQDELVMILLICWLFSSFLQGITGFGVPVAVCAPILISLGVQPLWSVIITLLGHAWANTYGTFALAWDALIIQSETQKILETKLIAGLLLLGVNFAGAILISWLYGRGKALRHILPFLLIISLIQGGGQLIVSFSNSAIAAFIPTTLALIAGWILLHAGFYTKSENYGAIHIFTHAGFVLLLTVIITLLLYLQKGYLNKQKMKSVTTATLKKIIPTSLGILFLIVMSQVLKGSGIMQLIAQGVTQITGKHYGFAVPFLGLLGAFVTSSNTSSNILLGSFQKTAADMISVNEAAILAAQTAGGAIGTVVGPSTILLGTTTAGCEGKEGEILRFMLPIVLVEAAMTGIMIAILIH